MLATVGLRQKRKTKRARQRWRAPKTCPTTAPARSKSFFESTNNLLCRGLDLNGLGLDLVDVADHVEGALGEVVVLAREDLLEALDGVLRATRSAPGCP